MNGNPLREERNLPGCRLCPRACGADRAAGEEGLCGAGKEIRIARAALHFWEEPCISGTKGSGAVFFSGCPLRCVYCQNREISRGLAGASVSVERLAEIFMELQEQQANNINLVTAGHYLPQVREALLLAKGRGLSVPVVYNTSSYEKPEALRMLEGLVDIYLRVLSTWILTWREITQRPWTIRSGQWKPFRKWFARFRSRNLTAAAS